MRVRAGIIGVCAALLLAACQAGTTVQTRSEDEEGKTQSAVTLLRATNSFAYPPYRTPVAMLKEMDVVVHGEVVSVEEALTEHPDEPGGAIIVGLQPVEEWLRRAGDPGETVHFWFSRPTNVDENVYREAFPMGTEIVLFGQNVVTSSDIRFATEVPDLVFAPVPQGLFIADNTGAFVSVWGDDEYTKSWRADSIAELRRQTGVHAAS